MDGVILIHGIGLHALSLMPMAWRLRRHGYRTLALTYPSLTRDIGACAAFLDEPIARFAESLDGRVHFVTHSMGGLVARACIARHRPRNLGRVVMLAPPFGGSEVADLLHDTALLRPLFRRLFGPAGQQLTTDAKLDALLGEIDFPLGVIAGNRPFFPFSVIRGPHDGKVSVAATRAPGMTDHVVLRVTHTLMVLDPRVAEQTLHFLREGRFRKA